MKYFIPLLLGILVFTACKKEDTTAPFVCENAAFRDQEDCEKYSKRMYPQFDITGEPLAWYSATIEGKNTSIAGGRDGISYNSGAGGITITNGPTITTGATSTTGVFVFSFGIERQHGFQGQMPCLLKFFSPLFPINAKTNILAIADSLFTPGQK
jgi:hypothetical protein